MLKLNAKEVVIKKALDYKVCSILNPETQQNVLFDKWRIQNPKKQKEKSMGSGMCFEVCDGPFPDSKKK
jgi:Pyruvate/2-oxoacid:ferredoxin oxidoreductase delta subunit